MKVITELTREKFKAVVAQNPGLLVVMYTAEWCGPCQSIKQLVIDRMSKLPESKVFCAILDVDDNFDLFAYQRSLKQATGIPTLHCYKNNVIREFGVSGADPKNINAFFDQVLAAAS